MTLTKGGKRGEKRERYSTEEKLMKEAGFPEARGGGGGRTVE